MDVVLALWRRTFRHHDARHRSGGRRQNGQAGPGPRLAACGMQMGGKEVHFTISLGLAQAGAATIPASLIKRADAALFASKAAGGNCAHLHNGKTYEPVAADQQMICS